MAPDLVVAKAVQDIIRTPVTDTNKIEDILEAAPALIRAEVIKLFKTNEEFRALFPEYAAYFDNRLVN
jgi:hypothetical protein